MTKELEYFVGLLGLKITDENIIDFTKYVNKDYVYGSFMENGFCREDFSFYNKGIIFIFDCNILVSIKFYLIGLDDFKPCKLNLLDRIDQNSTINNVLNLLGEPTCQSKAIDDVFYVQQVYEKCGLVLDWESDKASSLSKQQTQTNVKNDISWVKYAYRKCGFNFNQKHTDVVMLLDELKAKVRGRNYKAYVQYIYDKFGKRFAVTFKFNKYTEKLEEITLDLDQI